MEYVEDEVMQELRRNKALLLERYGGIEGLHQHHTKERPLLEAKGCHFETEKEFAERIQI
ncbi:hypothetical protein FACS1894200_11110 [Spirochaetia bacterium]|nr:hypothetical protein FACS1894200_11110 [Spirochaetia bacterium]